MCNVRTCCNSRESMDFISPLSLLPLLVAHHTKTGFALTHRLQLGQHNGFQDPKGVVELMGVVSTGEPKATFSPPNQPESG